MKKIFLASVVVFVLGCLGRPALEEETKAAAPDDKIMKLYQTKCASCHAKDGKGNAAMAKAFKLDPAALSVVSDTVQAKKDEELNAVTTSGKGKMPAYKGKITDAEIAGLTAYIRTLAPKKEETKEEPKK